jgi:serine/threonine protein kinase
MDLPVYKAIIVGIDAYPEFPLSGCKNDALSIAEHVRRNKNPFSTRVLIDAEATRAALKAELVNVLTDAKFSLFYFAGHGLRTDAATYLVTHDYQPNDEGVDFAFLTNVITRIAKPDQTVVVVLDCCHAGDATPRAISSMRHITSDDIPSLSGSGRVVMAACTGTETAKEKVIEGNTHGVFTYYLLQALDGHASGSDGLITVSSCYEYVCKELEELGIQRPVLRGDQTGRIILATGIARQGPTEIPKPKYREEAVISEAKQHVEDLFSSSATYTHAEWLSRGHHEACQRLLPRLEWFRRRFDDNPQLLRNADFERYWTDITQQYRQVCSLTPGIILGRVREIDALLGSGTFGTVWHIRASPSEPPYCFKSYHANDLRDLEKVSRFERGYKAMKQLDHPNIVKVFEYEEVPLGFYMQFIPGANLRQYHPATALEPVECIELLLRVGETLQHAHGRDVLHRDVKPENILVLLDDDAATSQPYLTDFDLSWFSSATQLTKVAEGFGSHFYAAPEQMNNPQSPVAHKPTVDAYSFGQVIFFALCGRDPAAFDPDANFGVLSEHLGNNWRNEKAAEMLLALYQACTIRSPDKREGDFRNICDRLSEILALLRVLKDSFTAKELLDELRFSIAGLRAKPAAPGADKGSVELRSQSQRTTVIVRVKGETLSNLALEATFIPDTIVMQGMTSVNARVKVNSRIDSALREYERANHIRRSAPKSGAFQSIITFDEIGKTPAGLKRCREIVVRVIDSIERT